MEGGGEREKVMEGVFRGRGKEGLRWKVERKGKKVQERG